MPHGQGITKNTTFALLSRLIRLLTNVLFFVGIARFYGVEAFGQFTTAHTLSTLFLLLADFGFDSLLPTEIASRRPQERKYIAQYFSFKLIFVTLATVGMLFTPLFQQLSSETRVLVQIFAIYVPFTSLNNFLFAVFKGYEKFHHETWIAFVTNLATLLLVIVLGVMAVPVTVLSAGFVGTRMIGTILGLITVRRVAKISFFPLSFKHWREIWPGVMIFGLHFVFSSMYFQLDTILLALWQGDKTVGIYQSAFKIVSLALIVPDIALNALMPALSRLWGKEKKEYDRYGQLLAKTLLMIGIPASVLLFVNAEQIITLVYGAGEFGPSVTILRIFALTVLVRYMVEPYGLMLTTSQRQKTRMFIVLGATCFSFTFNWFMIPSLGAAGAAVVSLTTNALVGVFFVIASGKGFLRWSLDKGTVLSALAVLVLGAAAWELRSVSMVMTIPLFLAVYAVVAYRVGFTADQLSMLLSWRSLLPDVAGNEEGRT